MLLVMNSMRLEFGCYKKEVALFLCLARFLMYLTSHTICGSNILSEAVFKWNLNRCTFMSINLSPLLYDFIPANTSILNQRSDYCSTRVQFFINLSDIPWVLHDNPNPCKD
jgi:hypothetical protein